MTALLNRIKRFAAGPQGRDAAASLRHAATDPRVRARARRLIGKLRRR
ncbi:hypothetical protein ABZ621_31920 [Streptomyces sp. NPDC007863]